MSSAIGPRRPASRTEPQTCGVRIWRKVKNLLYPHSQPLVQQAVYPVTMFDVFADSDQRASRTKRRTFTEERSDHQFIGSSYGITCSFVTDGIPLR